MMDRVPEPEVWTARLRDFVHNCLASTPGEEADRVREAALLLRGGTLTGPDAIDPVLVEEMLACGAAESAVLAMFRPEAIFMVSRGQGNCSLATVIVADGADEVMSEGSTLALALLAAYAAGLLAGCEQAGYTSHTPFAQITGRLH